MCPDDIRSAIPGASPAPRTAAAATPRITSHSLLGGRREVVIVHAEREYRLRLTQNGKLILTA